MHAHPQNLTGISGVPQGDPFSPLGLACVVYPAFQQLRVQIPRACHVLYADDRTSFGSEHDVQRIQTHWEGFCSSCRMKTNHALLPFLYVVIGWGHFDPSTGLGSDQLVTDEVTRLCLGIGQRFSGALV